MLSSSLSNPRWVCFLQVINVCADQRLLDSLRDCNKLLDLVQRGLSEYLETKRTAFPRSAPQPKSSLWALKCSAKLMSKHHASNVRAARAQVHLTFFPHLCSPGKILLPVR